MQQENQIPDLIDQGLAFHQEGRLEEAQAIYQMVLAKEANQFDALQLLGVLLIQTKQFTSALHFLTKALQIKPDYVEALFNRGLALKELHRLEEALASYDKAIAIKLDYAQAYSNRGNVLKELHCLEEALISYDKAIEIKPNIAEAHFNRGNTLKELHRLEEALISYDKAIEIKPNIAEAHFNRGNVLKEIGLKSEAKNSYDKALLIESSLILARWGRAMSALPIIPNNIEEIQSSRVEFSRELSDLDNWFTQEHLNDGHKAVGSAQPFYLAYQEEDNRELLSRYGMICQRLMSHWQLKEGIYAKSRSFDKLIKLGIVSHHIHQHPVWDALTKGWVEHIDRNRFEIFFFYTGAKIDIETEFAKSIAKEFITLGDDLSSWVKAIFAAQIDVLLYPEIGMDPISARLASLRLAPIQVGSWGHPDTTGLPTIDYYLSADLLEPDNSEEHYTEQLIKLPNLGSYHKSSSVIPASINLEKFGIKADQPILICPGTPFKYQPQYDHIFVDIAKRLGKCQFLFFTYLNKQLTTLLEERLSSCFLASGLNSKDYCVFIPWQPKSTFYGLMSHADIYLDTIGFSGFNTAFQAIECGIPIITREGRFMRGRLASGILKRIGLQELIAQDEDDFINLVVKTTADQKYNQLLRNKIKINRVLLYMDLEPVRALEQFIEDVHLKYSNNFK
ncbi:tetratricopeptide repeat protein [Polynucleobacter sp. Nonnen-W13]|uniref:O-linked N-acetylglucosamine transferase, SPINDLY family protein n=1 Tax=Polynucleobacter sp. Nonnen-W13 TaxID=1855625 RepID=UPI001C0E7582|nr:tetratricopeptide repeat protein [Polynucleobacter sp. Nonnen-W13]MBU3558524.1 tetratricopeptide repeat protein [Polynucleobacter sp. Nonnen-W13]